MYFILSKNSRSFLYTLAERVSVDFGESERAFFMCSSDGLHIFYLQIQHKEGRHFFSVNESGRYYLRNEEKMCILKEMMIMLAHGLFL